MLPGYRTKIYSVECPQSLRSSLRRSTASQTSTGAGVAKMMTCFLGKIKFIISIKNMSYHYPYLFNECGKNRLRQQTSWTTTLERKGKLRIQTLYHTVWPACYCSTKPPFWGEVFFTCPTGQRVDSPAGTTSEPSLLDERIHATHVLLRVEGESRSPWDTCEREIVRTSTSKSYGAVLVKAHTALVDTAQ